MKSKLTTMLSAAALGALIISGCGKTEQPVPEPVAKVPAAPVVKEVPATAPAAAEVKNEHATGKPLMITTQKELNDVLAASPVTVIQFYADWCGPCRMLKPTIAKIAQTYTGKVAVVQVDTDKARGLAMEYGVSGIPDVRIFEKTKQAKKLVGVNPEQAYKDVLDKALAK